MEADGVAWVVRAKNKGRGGKRFEVNGPPLWQEEGGQSSEALVGEKKTNTLRKQSAVRVLRAKQKRAKQK